MSRIVSREIRLASRPKGVLTAENFALAQTELEPLEDQQVLVRNRYMSLDPYMRGRMSEGKSYVPPFELGKPLEGGAVGEVIESRTREFKAGDAVTSNFGWREYFIASPKELHPVNAESFQGVDHLRRILDEAQTLVSDALAAVRAPEKKL